MHLKNACLKILDQLADVTSQIHPPDFYKPIVALGNSTIGQHMRHTLEFFICLEKGLVSGVINYDEREHDKLIESDKFIAMAALEKIKQFVGNPQQERTLTLEVGYDDTESFVVMPTNIMRELVYNIEHAVHHMALIKIGIKQSASYVKLPADFGIAASTMRFKESVEPSSH